MDTSLQTPEVIMPPQPPGPIKWLRDNLFNNWYNALLTVILLPLIFFALIGVIRWSIIEADWRPVVQFPMLYAVGQYPRGQLWRVGFGLSSIA